LIGWGLMALSAQIACH